MAGFYVWPSSLQAIGDGLLTHSVTVLTVLNTLLHRLTYGSLHQYPPLLLRHFLLERRENLRGCFVRSFIEQTRFFPLIGDGRP